MTSSKEAIKSQSFIHSMIQPKVTISDKSLEVEKQLAAEKKILFNVDNADTIPSHVFRYINHLYQKKQQDSTPLFPQSDLLAIPQVIRHSSQGSTKFNMQSVSEQLLKNQKTLQLELKKQELDLSKQANKYLKQLFKMGSTSVLNLQKVKEDKNQKKQNVQNQKEMNIQVPITLTTNEDESQILTTNPSQIGKFLDTNVSSQYFSNSIQEVNRSLDSGDDYNTDEFIRSVNSASIRIVEELNSLKQSIQNDDNLRIQSCKFNSEGFSNKLCFLDRQQAYYCQSQSRLQKLSEIQQIQDELDNTQNTRLKRNKKFIVSYYKKLSSKLIKGFEKNSQTQEPSYLNVLLRKEKNQEAKYTKKPKEKAWNNLLLLKSYSMSFGIRSQVNQSEKLSLSMNEQGVQTEWSDHQTVRKITQIQPDLYVPLLDRIQFILDEKQNKIEDEQQKKKFEEQRYFNTLKFTPTILQSRTKLDKPKSQQQVSKNLTYSKKNQEQKSLSLKMNEIEKVQELSFQPIILEFSRQIASNNTNYSSNFMDRQKEIQIRNEYKIEQQRLNQFSYQPQVSSKSSNLLKNKTFLNQNNTGSYTKQRCQAKNNQNEEKKKKLLFT